MSQQIHATITQTTPNNPIGQRLTGKPPSKKLPKPSSEQLYRILQKGYNDKEARDDFMGNLRMFFRRKPDTLKELVRYFLNIAFIIYFNNNNCFIRTVDDGRFFRKEVKDIMGQMKEQLQCPFRGVKAVVDLGIPISRYEVLTKPPQVIQDDGYFGPASIAGVEIPNMWASVKDVKKVIKDLKARFKFFPTGKEGTDACYWDVEDCIKFICRSEVYMEQMQDPHHLEIIVRGDGLPVGGNHACFLLLTLGNFGILSKCLGFNFPINIAEVDEKNREEVRLAFQHNMDKLNDWARHPIVEIAPGITVTVKVEWGGDESWLRMMLGLMSSKEALACIKCHWRRNSKYQPAGRVERVFDTLHALYEQGCLDQAAAPLITFADIADIHHCGMHAIIRFGKDLVQISFEHLQKEATHGRPKWEVAKQWFKSHRIKCDITYPIMFLFLFLFFFSFPLQ